MASDEDPLAALRDAVRDLARWFEHSSVKGVVVGGLAVSLLGQVRSTQDIDIVVWLGDRTPEQLAQSFQPFGFVPRLSNAAEFAEQARVLLLVHTPSHRSLDVSLGALPFEEQMISGAQQTNVGHVNLPLPRVEDLIVTKMVARRRRDLDDVERLLNRVVDVERVRRMLEEFAYHLDDASLVTDFDTLVKQSSRRGPDKS